MGRNILDSVEKVRLQSSQSNTEIFDLQDRSRIDDRYFGNGLDTPKKLPKRPSKEFFNGICCLAVARPVSALNSSTPIRRTHKIGHECPLSASMRINYNRTDTDIRHVAATCNQNVPFLPVQRFFSYSSLNFHAVGWCKAVGRILPSVRRFTLGLTGCADVIFGVDRF